ncbi:MAG TPA: GMC family oxidoreductase [Kofleriaceae bacterium]|nr:GMC family oxidoreductase [Kofleriaceae bacterium]
MIRSSASLTGDAELEADVCVIGAGAAGLVLARELASSGARVCLLESGGRKPAPGPDPMYQIHATQLPVADDSRVRAFGGTTTVWAGRWKRFDPIDFEPRPWVRHSGWPVSYASLDPYYVRAGRAVGVRDHATHDAGEADTVAALVKSDAVVPTVFHTLREDQRDFGRALTRTIEGADSVDAVLDAHVVQLERDRRAVGRVLVRGAGGGRFAVRARQVVIATGGIENARTLLLSGIGNQHDQVGRYFMDHPKAKVGVVETYEPLDMSSWEGLSENAPVWVGLRLSDEVQRAEEVLNSYVFLEPAFERDIPRRLARRAIRPRRCRLLALRNYMEQEPDPDNRVFLGADRDPLGQARASVTWTLGERDRRTIVALHRVLRRELQRAGVGELDSPLLHPGGADGGVFPEFQDASHHMGTTRMGTDPRTSVVDPDCRVHDTDNVFVAGSSVFPTSGYANPTATIAALAVRLADHLKARR